MKGYVNLEFENSSFRDFNHLSAERMNIEVNPYTRYIESFTQKSRDRVLQTISFEEIKKIKALKYLPSTFENTRK